MAVPGSLPQRMYVLAWNPDSGRVGLGTPLGALLRAAALADLYAGGHVTDDRGRVVLAARRPCDDPVLAGLLDEIAASKPRRWQHWVDRRQRATVTAVRHQLADGGWARLRPYRILGLIPATAVTVRDPRVRGELLRRVGGALTKPVHRVDPADAALVAISAAAGLSVVLDRKARRANRRRIRELTALSGPAVPALRRSIEAAALGGEAAAQRLLPAPGAVARSAAVVAAVLAAQAAFAGLATIHRFFSSMGLGGFDRERHHLAALHAYAAVVVIAATAAAVVAVALAWREPAGGWRALIPARPWHVAAGLMVAAGLPLTYDPPPGHTDLGGLAHFATVPYAVPWGLAVAMLGWVRGRPARVIVVTVLASAAVCATFAFGSWWYYAYLVPDTD